MGSGHKAIENMVAGHECKYRQLDSIGQISRTKKICQTLLKAALYFQEMRSTIYRQ
jgi:hypothetical protein